ncbi:MAG: YdaS family helix-turn-helix protein [Rhodocyclaceae bacterium]
MDLKTYFTALNMEQRDEFAGRCDTSRGHIQNVMYGQRPCSPELAAAIERESKGAVTRCELRPKDWLQIWPELERRTKPRTTDKAGA